MLNWLINLLSSKIEPKQELSFGTISSVEIENFFPSEQDGITIKLFNNKVTVNDYNYKLPTKKQIADFLTLDSTNNYKYIMDEFDCDDFAIILHGKLRERFVNFAIGYAQSSTHSFNFFIDEKKKLWLIEPQTDKIFTTKDTRYKIEMVLI